MNVPVELRLAHRASYEVHFHSNDFFHYIVLNSTNDDDQISFGLFGYSMMLAQVVYSGSFGYVLRVEVSVNHCLWIQ